MDSKASTPWYETPEEKLIDHLQAELDMMLRTLEEIRTLNSLGKTREITDIIINPILKSYNR
jgi:hypothetical protein